MQVILVVDAGEDCHEDPSSNLDTGETSTDGRHLLAADGSNRGTTRFAKNICQIRFYNTPKKEVSKSTTRPVLILFFRFRLWGEAMRAKTPSGAAGVNNGTQHSPDSRVRVPNTGSDAVRSRAQLLFLGVNGTVLPMVPGNRAGYKYKKLYAGYQVYQVYSCDFSVVPGTRYVSTLSYQAPLSTVSTHQCLPCTTSTCTCTLYVCVPVVTLTI